MLFLLLFPYLRCLITVFSNETLYRSKEKGWNMEESWDSFPVCRGLGYLESQRPLNHFDLPSLQSSSSLIFKQNHSEWKH